MTQSAGSGQAQELGRIDRPSAAQYSGRRKLILVPLVYSPAADDPAGAAALQNYWEQAQTQVAALENALGGLHRVYHESITAGAEEGLQQLQAGDRRSHSLVSRKCGPSAGSGGAVLEATEDMEILLETLDLQRCLMMPLASPSVAARLNEWYAETNRRRYEHIASRIDATLEENGVGLLLISERHQVQFPSDIEVFYVSPPALDEFRRWLQNWAARQQQAAAAEAAAAYPEPESVQDPAGDDAPIDTPPE